MNSISAEDIRVPEEIIALRWTLGFLLLLMVLLNQIFDVSVKSIFVGITLIVGYLVFSIWKDQGVTLGNCAKVSEQQFPEIYLIFKKAVEALGMEEPYLFIEQSPNLNARALGIFRKKCVVLHSALVESLSLEELQTVIGHELGHIKCGHTTLLPLIGSAKHYTQLPILTTLLEYIFQYWGRQAEYTCDRAGLLVCRDIELCVSTECKMAVGAELFKKMNIHTLLADQGKLLEEDTIAKVSEFDLSHPFMIKRIRALLRFSKSTEYLNLGAIQIERTE